MSIGIFTLPASRHEGVDQGLAEFIRSVEAGCGLGAWQRITPETMEAVDLPLIFVPTGGTEGRFLDLYPRLPEPYLLLTSGAHNSLAASLEILSYLRQQGKRAEVLHGSIEEIAGRIRDLDRIFRAKRRLQGMRVGLVGEPSDWLIASFVDPVLARQTLGVEIVPIKMDELMRAIDDQPLRPETPSGVSFGTFDPRTTAGALRVYGALRQIVAEYDLGALTVRCFDLLDPVQNTGCLGLALLNDQGVIAGCEGDLPALLSMVILNALTDEPVFMANPSRLDLTQNQIVLAHCTCPLSMTEGYSLHSHFESGLGVAIRGQIPTGRATVFKLSSDCQRHFVSGADLMENLSEENLCRTQVRLRLDRDLRYFLQDPLGNHHLVSRGDHAHLISAFFQWL